MKLICWRCLCVHRHCYIHWKQREGGALLRRGNATRNYGQGRGVAKIHLRVSKKVKKNTLNTNNIGELK